MSKHRSFVLTTSPTDSSSQHAPSSAAKAYSHALKLAGAQQAIVLLLASLILDGGQTFRFCLVPAITNWVCTLLIGLRRPERPTRVDLFIVTFGFWLAMPLIMGIAFVIDALRP